MASMTPHRVRSAVVALLVVSTPAIGLLPFDAHRPSTASAQGAAPQKFELSTGERAGFAFAVAQPGPIVVTVAAQGAPVTVSLLKPGGAAIDRPVSGAGTIQYAATAEDVKQGQLWSVSVRLQQAAARPTAVGGRGRPMVVALAAAASGTVSIQHPPGDTTSVKNAMNARGTLRRAAPASGGPDIGALRLSAMLKDEAAQQARQLATNRARLPADVYQKTSQVISLRAQGRAAAMEAMTLGTAPAGAARGATARIPAGLSQTAGASTGTGAAGTTNTGGAAPVGSTKPATTVANPRIDALDVSEGTPGTAVFITGTNFSETPGSVQLMVTQGKTLRATIMHWSDTQIYLSVPDTTGVAAMPGMLYVQRGAQQSNLVPFKFLPTLISYTLGWSDTDMDLADFQSPFASGMADHLPNWPFIGLKGDDHFYKTLQLKNGWVVDTAYVEHIYIKESMGSPNRADAYVTEYRPGTASPYLKVHWWAEPMNEIGYVPRVVIVGPKGTSWK
jgi:hypothetical protein